MSVETKFYCDLCKKEVWGNNHCSTVAVFISNGVDRKQKNKFDHERFANLSYKYKEIYYHLLCDECLGEDSYTGLYDKFDLEKEGLPLLKRIFKFLKL